MTNQLKYDSVRRAAPDFALYCDFNNAVNFSGWSQEQVAVAQGDTGAGAGSGAGAGAGSGAGSGAGEEGVSWLDAVLGKSRAGLKGAQV